MAINQDQQNCKSTLCDNSLLIKIRLAAAMCFWGFVLPSIINNVAKQISNYASIHTTRQVNDNNLTAENTSPSTIESSKKVSMLFSRGHIKICLAFLISCILLLFAYYAPCQRLIIFFLLGELFYIILLNGMISVEWLRSVFHVLPNIAAVIMLGTYAISWLYKNKSIKN